MAGTNSGVGSPAIRLEFFIAWKRKTTIHTPETVVPF